MMETKQRQSCFPMAMAAAGDVVRLVSIGGGCGIRQRLFNMGVHENESVKVIRSQWQGGVLIASGGNRYVLGGGMALKIQVVKENLA